MLSEMQRVLVPLRLILVLEAIGTILARVLLFRLVDPVQKLAISKMSLFVVFEMVPGGWWGGLA